MAKPGKERRRRRGVKQKARAMTETEIVEQAGDHWGRGEHENNALVRRSLRWNTPATGSELKSIDTEQMNSLTARELAILITRSNMLHTEKKISNVAVRNLIMMEGQNQRDEFVHDDLLARQPGITGMNIEHAQIILTCPDNNRGPDRIERDD